MKSVICDDCLFCILQYCDLKTLITPCLLISKTIKSKIETNEIHRVWDFEDSRLLVKNGLDSFLLELLKNNVLDEHVTRKVLKECMRSSCYRSLDFLLENFDTNLLVCNPQHPVRTITAKLDDIFLVLEHILEKRESRIGSHLDIVYYFAQARNASKWENIKILLKRYPEMIPIKIVMFAFCGACENGNLSMVKYFIDTYESDHKKEFENWSIATIQCAAFYEQLHILEYFYETKRMDLGNAIWCALKNGWCEWLSLLLLTKNFVLSDEHFRLIVTNMLNIKTSWTCIRMLLENENFQKRVQERKSKDHKQYNFVFYFEMLKTISDNGKLDIEMLENVETFFDFMSLEFDFFKKVLSILIDNQQHDQIKHVLSKHGKYMTKNTIKMVLMYMCKRDDSEFLEIFVCAHENENSRKEEEEEEEEEENNEKILVFDIDTCLRWYCQCGNLEMVKHFVSIEPLDFNKKVIDQDQDWDYNSFCVQLEKERRINPDTPCSNAFMNAICSGNQDLIYYLIKDCNANVNEKEVLECVIAKHDLNLLKFILQDGKNEFQHWEMVTRFCFGYDFLDGVLFFLNHEKCHVGLFTGDIYPMEYSGDCLAYQHCDKINWVLKIFEKYPDSFELLENFIKRAFAVWNMELVVILLENYNSVHDPSKIIKFTKDNDEYFAPFQYCKTMNRHILEHPRLDFDFDFLLNKHLACLSDERFILILMRLKIENPQRFGFLKIQKEQIKTACFYNQLDVLNFLSRHHLLDHTMFDSELLDGLKENGHTRVLDFIKRKILL